jgi:hypothetical protein
MFSVLSCEAETFSVLSLCSPGFSTKSARNRLRFAKVPSPVHAGFQGITQAKLSTKGRLTSLRFSEVIDGLELVQFFLCLITDRLEMIDDGEGCPGFHA